MLDKNFWGLLESQIESLKTSEGKVANSAILETVKLLLSGIDSSETTIQDYDKFDLREIFAAYSEVAACALEFYSSQKEHLDPAALAGKLGTTLDNAKVEIKDVSEKLAEIEANEKELLSIEPKLKEIKATYDALKEKITELTNIQNETTPEIIAQMKKEIATLEDETKKSKKEYDNVSDKLKKQEKDYEKVKNALDELTENKSKLGKEIISIITEHYETLKILFDNNQLSVDEILYKIKEYESLYEQLETAFKENAELLATYEAILGENGMIVESMKKYGVKSLNNVLEDIENAKKTILDDIEAYNFILKNVITFESETRDALERRQGKKN